MKVTVVVASLVLLAVVGDILVRLRPSPPPLAEVKRELPAAVAARPAPPPPTVDVRTQIREVVEKERPRLQTPREVERYLDDLGAQARRNRQVTALEVLPGIAAIRERYQPEEANQRIQRFSAEMAALSAQLER